ncbi:hypothetical protein BH09ACT12_BH09ACT12_31850 [soil metagenome]
MPDHPEQPEQWGSSYPPPGAPPPPGAQPDAGYPAYRSYPAPPPPPDPRWVAPGMLGAAHKPGAMALRPLSLGDIYDAAFRIIRFNPKATVGSAVLVASVAMAFPLLLTAILTFTSGLTYDATSTSTDTEDLAGLIASFGALAFGGVLQAVGLIFVTGMVAHVTAAAAIGRRLTLGQAWAATRGKRWRLIGLSLVLGLLITLAVTLYVVLWVVVALSAPTGAVIAWGLVTVPAFIAGLWWFWIRVYYLPVPALMLEDVGITGAIGRGYRLTSRQFWRTFGIALLTVVLVNIAGGILSFPISLVGQIGVLAVDERNALLLLITTQALSTVISTAFVAPFTAAVASLQYLDQRMRKEGYDVDLMRQAGVLE